MGMYLSAGYLLTSYEGRLYSNETGHLSLPITTTSTCHSSGITPPCVDQGLCATEVTTLLLGHRY